MSGSTKGGGATVVGGIAVAFAFAFAFGTCLAVGAVATACAAPRLRPMQVSRTSAPIDDAPPRTGLLLHEVTSVGEGSLGPYVALRDGDAIAAYVAGGKTTGRKLVTVPLAKDGGARGEARAVAGVGDETRSLVVRALRGGGADPGFAAVWSEWTDRGQVVSALGLGADGAARGGSIDLGRTADDVVWTEIVPTARGAVVVWAEETARVGASVYAAAFDVAADGALRKRGGATRVAHGATGWQVASARAGHDGHDGHDGIAVAVVLPSKEGRGAAPGAEDGARVSTIVRVDVDDAGTVKRTAPIASNVVVAGDVGFVRVRGGYVVAWSGRGSDEARVMVAVAPDDGAVIGPASLDGARGASSLVGIVAAGTGTASGSASAYLAWEDPFRRAWAPVRQVHVATIDAAAHQRAARDVVPLVGRASPELAVLGDDLVVLASAPAADRATNGATPASVPMMYRFSSAPPASGASPAGRADRAEAAQVDGAPSIVQREVIGGDGEASPALAWGLGCATGRCVALCARAGGDDADATHDARIQSTELVARAHPPPPSEDAPFEPPPGTRVTTVASEPVVAIAATRLGDVTLVATLAEAEPSGAPPQASASASASARAASPRSGAEGASGETGEVVAVRVVDAKGVATAPTPITRRALTQGGVAIAPGGTLEDGAVVAWVARDSTGAQVHVARVDASGKKTKDAQLTVTTGGASDVAIAWAGSPGAASGAPAGAATSAARATRNGNGGSSSPGWIVAWVDGRHGGGEVYATKIDRDLTRVAREERVSASGSGSGSAPGDASELTALARPGEVWLAWVDARAASRGGAGEISLATLRSHDGARTGAEAHVAAIGGHVRAPALAPSGDGVAVAWLEETAIAGGPACRGCAPAETSDAVIAFVDPKRELRSEPVRVRGAGDGSARGFALDPSDARLHGFLARATPDGLLVDAVDLGDADATSASAGGARPTPLFELADPPASRVALVVPSAGPAASPATAAVYFDDLGTRDVDGGAVRPARRIRRAVVAAAR